MKLVASLTSPFARKIRIMLLEKSLPFELVQDIPWNEGSHVPDYNPLGKVPVLITDSGDTVFDSRVIAQYLETLPSVLPLIPADPSGRIAVLRWEALADGVSDAAALIYLEHARRPPEQRSADWLQRQQDKMKRGLAEMEKQLKGKSWCSGEVFSLADVAVCCTLGYLDLRFPEINWRAQSPALSALSARLDERAAVIGTRPPV